jgi:hypothetical protein
VHPRTPQHRQRPPPGHSIFPIQFFEARLYPSDLYGSRPKPAGRCEQSCNNADGVDYYHFFAAISILRMSLKNGSVVLLWLHTTSAEREACGLRDSRTVMCDYNVPGEVQQHMAAVYNRPLGAD